MFNPNPSSADAYKRAYETVLARQPADIKKLIIKMQEDNTFSTRETRQFIKEVVFMAQYEPTEEEIAEAAKKGNPPKNPTKTK